MANPTDHLTTVRAALDLAAKATPGEWWQGSIEHHHVFAERGNPSLIAPEAGRVLLRMNEHFPAYAHDAAAIVALRNAAPAIAALADECERLRAAMRTISGIRDSIIGAQALNWSEHVYPLVAALDGAGFTGAGYETARANVGTLLQRIATLEAELAQARAAAPITDDLHPDGCHTAAASAFRDCSGDGHHECRTCTRFDEAERAKRIGEF